MKRIRTHLRAIVVVAVVGMLAAVVIPQPKPLQASGSAPVTVTNTPLPVSLTGTGSISGNVNAAQSGTWNVGINNATTSPVPMREVDNPARHRFQHAGICEATDVANCSTTFTVPSGKLLVIETVTAGVSVPPGDKATAHIATDQDGIGLFHDLPLQLVATDFLGSGFDMFQGIQLIRLYADPGTTVTFEAFRAGSAAGGTIGHFTISGYLVDCGAGSGCPIP